jgi:hypothetical protein
MRRSEISFWPTWHRHDDPALRGMPDDDRVRDIFAIEMAGPEEWAFIAPYAHTRRVMQALSRKGFPSAPAPN